MTQQELADALYVSRSLVAMWETGARTPDGFSVERMSEIFGVKPEVILGDSCYAYGLRLEKELINEEFDEFTNPGEPDGSGSNGGAGSVANSGNRQKAEQIIDAFFRQISARDKKLFMSRYYSMKTLQAIADESGLSLSAVKKNLSKTRKRLKAFIAKEEAK